MEINEGYVIRRTILFDNKCGFVIGEDPKAPNPFVTWQFNERDGRRATSGAITTTPRSRRRPIFKSAPRAISGAFA